MKALRTHVASATRNQEVDDDARLRRLDAENGQLRDLVRHCALHSADGHGGYDQMTAGQKPLYDAIIGRRALASTLRIAGAAVPGTLWRSCEFCGCRTNALERVCCRRGRDADRQNWHPNGTKDASAIGE